ncbi:MAG: HEAT repeat domain-containing protein [Gemmatimonadales bacterium]
MIGQRLLEFYLRSPGLTLIILGNALFITGAFFLAVGALLLRIRNDRKAGHWAELERRWEATSVEVVTDIAPPEDVWQVVDPADRLRFLNFLLRFARRLTGAERRRVDDLAAPYLELVLPQLSSRSAERRARAVQTLATLGSRRYARQVLAALDDPAPLVAMVAARSLARHESPDFAGPILRRLPRFGHWRPSFLASMLASIGPSVAPALRNALGNRRFEPLVRSVAAEALRELNDYQAADVAGQVLDETTDKDLIISTLGLLAHVGRADQADKIRRHLAAEEPIVRSRAISALGRVGSRSEMPAVVAALDDPSPWVALRAAEALLEAHDPALARIAASDHPRADLARQLLAGGGA